MSFCSATHTSTLQHTHTRYTHTCTHMSGYHLFNCCKRCPSFHKHASAASCPAATVPVPTPPSPSPSLFSCPKPFPISFFASMRILCMFVVAFIYCCSCCYCCCSFSFIVLRCVVFFFRSCSSLIFILYAVCATPLPQRRPHMLAVSKHLHLWNICLRALKAIRSITLLFLHLKRIWIAINRAKQQQQQARK